MDNLLQNNNTQVPSLESLQDFVKRWNYLYPVDRWWRDKYKVAFNSKKHRKTRMIDMRIDYEEDYLYIQSSNNRIERDLLKEEYVPGKGDWIHLRKVKDLSKNQIDDVFDQIDIDSVDENGDGQIII